ncbi:MAG: hypothetical protein MJ252_24620 [archaeon]|nr:hypothetical protein [archaeon]
MSSQELPRIRQVVFIHSADRQYCFDVNENITFHNLKKMISAASDVGKLGLRIFHDGEEFTKYEKETLDYFFPTQEKVVFDLRFTSQATDDYDRLLKVRLNQEFCKFHPGKYPYFYCFTCNKSICSQCVLDGDHQGHNIFEKYDYLQSSRILIDRLFKDINVQLENLGEDKVNELYNKIGGNIGELIRMLQQIEGNMKHLVEQYYTDNQDYIEQIKKNYQRLKGSCAEGLDLLKNKLDIEDMMLNEEIFLTFHKKYRALELQRDKFLEDIKKQKEFNEGLKKLEGVIDQTYGDIYAFLIKYLSQNMINGFIKELQLISVEPLDKQKVIDEILRGVIPQDKESFKESYRKKGPGNYHFEGDELHIIGGSGCGSYSKEIEDHLKHCEHCSSAKKMGMSLIDDNASLASDVEGELQKGKTVYLACPVMGGCELVVYNSKDKNVYHNTIQSVFFQEGFVDGCAWVNYKNNLYVAGGIKNGRPCQDFYKYNPVKNEITRLSPMPEGRWGHSMCSNDNCIYLVGGNDKSILKYDLKANKWSKMKMSLREKRFHPIAFIRGEELFAIFGEDDARMLPSGEKGRLGQTGAMTKFVDDSENMRIFAGTIFTSPDEVMMVGGQDRLKHILSTGLKLNLVTGSTTPTAKQLSLSAFFGQTLLPLCDCGTYGYFSKEENNPFVTLKFSE